MALQEQVGEQIVDGLEAWRKASEKVAEETFRTIYGAPALQAALGIDTGSKPRARPPTACSPALVEARGAELRRGDRPRRAA